MTNTTFKEKGFTLIETLLAVGVFAVLGAGIAALTYLFVLFGEQLPQEQLRAKVLGNHQLSLQSLKRNIRESSEILRSATVNAHLYNTGTTTLILRQRAVDAGGSMMAHSHDIVVYTLLGSSPPFSLRKIVEPGAGSAAMRADLILNNAVRELIFSYNHPDLSRATAVSVRLATQKSDNVNSHLATSTINVTLR